MSSAPNPDVTTTASPLRVTAASLFALGLCACPSQQPAAPRPAARANVHDAGSVVSNPAPHLGDLAQIEKTGVLRIATVRHATAYLPVGPSREADERALVEQFAQARGLGVLWRPHDSPEDALDAVREGRADLAASRLTVTAERAKKLAFTRALWVTDEIVIAKGKAPSEKTAPDDNAPDARTARTFASGARILIPRGSSYLQSIDALRARYPGLVVEEVEGTDVDLAERITRVRETETYTVLDKDALTDVGRFLDVHPVATLRRGVKIAWAVRKTAPRLRAAANAFLVERALSAHSRAVFKGDLDEIRARGVLRLITRNNGVTYYLHKGEPHGFDYGLARAFARSIGVRLQVVLPRPGETLIDVLDGGRGDVIAASWSITGQRKARVRFSLPYLHVDELVVARASDPDPPRTLAALKGRRVVVRTGSSYEATLRALPDAVRPRIETVPTDVETEDLIARLREGRIDLTVADTHIIALERALVDDIVPVLALTAASSNKRDAIGKPASGAKDIAFAVRKDAPKLASALSAWVQKNYRGTLYNLIKQATFGKSAPLTEHREHRAHKDGELSPYDDVFKRVASRVGIDWRLLAAQAYQESRFDPAAKSWVGARGLFQLMPRTFAELAPELGLEDIVDIEDNTRAAAHYLNWLMERFEAHLPLATRIHFALAAYNAGLGHVQDARRLSRRLGRSGERWFDDVEKSIRLLKQPKYYKRARYGYCRGDEPAAYVAAIQQRYDQYRQLDTTSTP